MWLTKSRFTAPSLAVQMTDPDEISDEEELLDESEETMSEADDGEFASESDDGDEDDQMEDADDTLVPTAISPNLDLEALRIFHRFVSITIHTLPGPSFDAGMLCYWENTVLPLAFSRHWLMSGVLAISVCMKAQ